MTGKVYEAINAITGALAKTGIGKDQVNTHQRYKFRGIDDVYNALAPLLAEHKLCIIPRVTSREVTEKVSSKGSVLFYVLLWVEFDFVCAEDGSKHTVIIAGEAMDSGDKGTNKAMSAAYKYACLQTFCIPTEGDNDAEATTHEVKSNLPEHITATKTSGGATKYTGVGSKGGPHKTLSALQAAVKLVGHEVNGCGDGDELLCFMNSEETIATIQQCIVDLPEWYHGDGEDKSGLDGLITKKTAEFERKGKVGG